MEVIKSNWQSPSNIAIVKYWGKKGIQLPANPSISFTLDNVYTKTEISLESKTSPNEIDMEFYFEGSPKPEFLPKILSFLKIASESYSWINEHKLIIHSQNNFPHGTGIASSASSMSALALCVTDIQNQLQTDKLSQADFLKKASFWSRLGSGSACRSVYGGFVAWGKSPDLPNSSDEYAIEIEGIHPVFSTIQDSVLIIDDGEKSVSSTRGHNLLNEHWYASKRFEQGFSNNKKLLKALQSGDTETFGQIAEEEALVLHAMMLTSSPGYFLIKPNTLVLIEKIRAYRKITQTPVYFTMDAGPNIHLLYFEKDKHQILEWINSELVQYCAPMGALHCGLGKGATSISNSQS